MQKEFKTISPVDGSVYVQRPYASDSEIAAALAAATSAQQLWCSISMAERQEICSKAVDAFKTSQTQIVEELSWQMGRPLQYGPGEIRGFEERARYMIDIAPGKLADIKVPEQAGFTRFIQRVPLGLVFSIVPWNYPYLTAVNSIIPAMMAGNAVIMKPSSQTPLTAECLFQAFNAAGLPEGIFQTLFLSHETCGKLIQSDQINYVAFTGSEAGGSAVEKSAVGRFIDIGLELGGKDAAYVRSDVNVKHAAENLVDGAYFNSGQSCCGIERIYVHQDVYAVFVEEFIELVSLYKLGNPLDQGTTLGPMARTSLADKVRDHISEAVAKGAKTGIDPDTFDANQAGTPYLAPQVLLNVDHSMKVMSDESFGPVVGIMKVSSDEEAIKLINDSCYGLTASIWTSDEAAAIAIGQKIATGTCFMNRCDYLDPALAWTGIKQSGKGCTLSEVGYEKLSRPKSFHLRTQL